MIIHLNLKVERSFQKIIMIKTKILKIRKNLLDIQIIPNILINNLKLTEKITKDRHLRVKRSLRIEKDLKTLNLKDLKENNYQLFIGCINDTVLLVGLFTSFEIL